ncbi:MAG: metallophosphoesterase, partial [Draconibacterium sp.]|nr:metallophosphoesterase [Draconibacterium sp.]
ASTYYFTVNTPNSIDIFICLDTGSGTLGSKQLEWLKQVLEERHNYRNCMLFTHCNFFRNRHTGSTNPLVEELHVLLELCAKYKVNTVITGHDHKKDVVELGETTFITTDALHDDYKNAGYLQLEISGKDIGYNFINF